MSIDFCAVCTVTISFVFKLYTQFYRKQTSNSPSRIFIRSFSEVVTSSLCATTEISGKQRPGPGLFPSCSIPGLNRQHLSLHPAHLFTNERSFCFGSVAHGQLSFFNSRCKLGSFLSETEHFSRRDSLLADRARLYPVIFDPYM